jgi:pimeloyl-ACP methyl ester carboxylesterase
MRSLLPTLALLAALLVAAPSAGAPDGIPSLQWRNCDDGFQCATAEVPRDYARPHGAKVQLALVRRPALDQEHRIGSLFLNPGGPGRSAINFVREAPPIAFQILSKFDWIGFDPRGVGASKPAVDCDELPEPIELMSPDTFDLHTLLQRGRALARLCQNRDPAFLGETYASLFPGRARALVLDSPVDGDVWLNRPFHAAGEQSVGYEASLDRFFAACAADREACRFGLDADTPEDAFDDLVARLDETPIDLGDGRTLDGQDLLTITSENLNAKRNWPRLAAGLAAAEAGDVEALRDFGDDVASEGYDLLYDVFSTYLSVERRYPRRLRPYLELPPQGHRVGRTSRSGHARPEPAPRSGPARTRGATMRR